MVGLLSIDFAEKSKVSKQSFTRRVVPVSVIIPCYNNSHSLERCLDSVFEQTVQPYEIVIVDDCSQDDSMAVIKRLAQTHRGFQFRVSQNNTNIGAAGSRNVAMNQAASEFVAFLDADDCWHPCKLELQYNWMLDNPDVVLLAHRSVVDGEEDWDHSYSDAQFTLSVYLYSYRQLLLRTRFSTPSVMLRTPARFRFDNDFRYAEDFDLWLSCASDSGVVAISNLPLAKLYKGRFGVSGLSSFLWRMHFGVLAVYQKQYLKGRVTYIYYLVLLGKAWIAFSLRGLSLLIKKFQHG